MSYSAVLVLVLLVSIVTAGDWSNFERDFGYLRDQPCRDVTPMCPHLRRVGVCSSPAAHVCAVTCGSCKAAGGRTNPDDQDDGGDTNSDDGQNAVDDENQEPDTEDNSKTSDPTDDEAEASDNNDAEKSGEDPQADERADNDE